MDFRTIDKDFEYQMKEVFKQMKEEAIKNSESFDSNYVWKNSERFGELVFDAIEEFCGVGELVNKLEE